MATIVTHTPKAIFHFAASLPSLPYAKAPGSSLGLAGVLSLLAVVETVGGSEDLARPSEDREAVGKFVE